MTARTATGLAGLAVVLSIAALVVAILALNQGPSALSVPPGAYTKALVEEAIERYNHDGKDATIAHYMDSKNVDGEWYVFIINEQGRTISHHNPNFLDRDPSERVDSTGYFYGEALLDATEKGQWVDYALLDPETGEEGKKHTWAKRHDGLIFASGWYER